jgi:trigger factor
MHIQREQKKPTQTHLTITAAAEDLLPIKNHVLGHFKKSAKVPGFRPGKAPLSLIEKNIDQKALSDEFLEHAVNDLYRKALEQEKIRPIAAPEVQLKKFVPFTTLEFEADVETVGEIKLADYKTLKLAKTPVTVSAKDVNEVMTNLQKRLAERSEVKRAAKEGDEVIIDFAGSDEEGKPISGADGKDYPLNLGSKSFIPGFEDNILDMKAGEEKEPKLDDELAKKAGPFKTVAELKADIKTQLKAEREREAQNQYENKLIQQIVEKSTVQIPEVLIEEQAQRLEDEEKRNLVYRGQTWQEHLDAEGVTEEEHRKRHKPDAELRVKAGLILSEIADREQLSVEPEELEIRLQMLKGQYKDPSMQTELDKPENQQEIAAQLLTEKTIAKLVDYAK